MSWALPPWELERRFRLELTFRVSVSTNPLKRGSSSIVSNFRAHLGGDGTSFFCVCSVYPFPPRMVAAEAGCGGGWFFNFFYPVLFFG